MDTYDSGKEGGSKGHEDGQSDYGLGRAIVKAASSSQDPQKGRPDCKGEEKDVGDRSQKNVKGNDSGSSVDKGNTQGEQDPANDIIPNTRREDDDTDLTL